MGEDLLCSRCQNLPFGSLFTGISLHNGDRDSQSGRFDHIKALNDSVQFGTLEEIWRQDDCAFCRLVRHTFETNYGKDYMETKLVQRPRATVEITRSPLDPSFGLDEPTDSSGFCLDFSVTGVLLEREEKRTRDEFNRSWVLPKVQLVLRNDDTGWQPLFGRAVDCGAIDWGHIKRWLKACECLHSWNGFQEGKPTLPVPDQNITLSAIDVELSCVARLPQNAGYIALSYMWGKDQRVKLKKANADKLATPGFFNTPHGRPSRTIADAMEVTRLLGCKYLWVDALCITQDDEVNIQANINNMDQVYTNALVTIVAATGQDADAGLPGLSSDNPRTELQMLVNVRGLVVANMLTSDVDAIDFSKWNTRGWTYQERLLSRKLLNFTSHQVYYSCDQGCNFREDLHVDCGSAVSGSLDSRYQLDLENENLFDVYAITVAEYTKRFLTNREDKLKAMDGLFNHLAGPFQGPFFFGIPATVFDVGLLWIPIGACSRGSKRFPSWSWAGWDGPVKYAGKDVMANLCECTVSQAIIETSNMAIDGKWERCFDEETLEIYYKSSDPERSQYKFPRPLAAVGHNECQILAQEATGVLKIQTMTAVFRLTEMHSDMFAEFSSCAQGRHEQCHLAILDESGRAAGTIFVDGGTVPLLKDRNHKFLALCRSTLSRIDLDPSWDDKTKTFRSWTHDLSGVPEEDEDEDGLINEFGKGISRKGVFDKTSFSDRVFWPVFNVLLLSEPDNGIVERIGIGKIHVDAFSSVANRECILLS